MKKHILGFAIFSLIVGTTVAASAMFLGNVKKQTVEKEYVYTVSQRSCWRNADNAPKVKREVKIVQAVFDVNTKQLTVNFSAPTSENVDIQLMSMKPSKQKGNMSGFVKQFSMTSFDSENKAVQTINLPDKWSDSLKSTDSMYITIKTTDNALEYDPFNKENATSVLIVPKQ